MGIIEIVYQPMIYNNELFHNRHEACHIYKIALTVAIKQQLVYIWITRIHMQCTDLKASNQTRQQKVAPL